MNGLSFVGDGPANAMWMLTNGKTLYQFDSNFGLSPHNFSNALNPAAISAAYDKPRGLFWTLASNYEVRAQYADGELIWLTGSSTNANRILANSYVGGAVAYSTVAAGSIDEFSLTGRATRSAAVTTPISSLCYETVIDGYPTYIFVNGTNNIGLYTQSVVNSSYQDTTPYTYDQIVRLDANTFYGVESANKTIVKFSLPVYTPIWTYTLSDAGTLGKVIACSNNTLVTYDDHHVYVLRDDGTAPVIIGSSYVLSTVFDIACDERGDTGTSMIGTAICEQFAGDDIIPSSSSSVSVSESSESGVLSSVTDWTWRKTELYSASWHGMAMSRNGSYIAVQAYGNPLTMYISSNRGATWTPRQYAHTELWYEDSPVSVAMSGDGKYLVATTGYSLTGGTIWGSTNYGVTWAQHNPIVGSGFNMADVAMSVDGKHVCTSETEKYIYNSSDYGVTWDQRVSAGMGNWWSTAMSADGMKQIMTTSPGGELYLSENYGLSWTYKVTLGYIITSAKCSADGQTILVCETDGGVTSLVHVSHDRGDTWSIVDVGAGGYWLSATMTPDGNIMWVSGHSGTYVSTNSGLTWRRAGSYSFANMATSEDGTLLVAGDEVYGYVYIGEGVL